MIFTQRQAREKIESLQSRISELESESASKDETIQSLQAETSEASANAAPQSARVLELEEEVLALGGQIETLQSSASAKDAEITKLTEAATATAEKISIEAARQLASSGHPTPIANTPDADTDDKIMSRAAFNSLTPAARLKFVKAGGKIS